MAGSFWEGFATTTATFAAIPGVGWYSLIPGLVGGLVTAGLGYTEQDREAEARAGQYYNQIQNYKADILDLEENARASARDYRNEQWSVRTERDVNSSIDSQVNLIGNKQAYDAVSQATMQATMAVSSGLTQQSTSGFRTNEETTKAMLIAQQKAIANKAVAQTRTQADLQILSAYANAGGKYSQATQQIRGYDVAVANLKRTATQQWDKLQSELLYTEQAYYDALGEYGGIPGEGEEGYEDFVKFKDKVGADEAGKYKNDSAWDNFLDFIWYA